METWNEFKTPLLCFSMMQSLSCHTGPVFHPSDQVFVHCSDSFSSFLNHIYAKRDRRVSQRGKIKWLQTKYSNMYEANRTQLQQQQHTQVWMWNGIRVCWGAAEVSRCFIAAWQWRRLGSALATGATPDLTLAYEMTSPLLLSIST